jgi:hypothetical protein
MKEIEVKVEVGGETYRANRSEDGKVSISRWNTNGCFWEWAGDGEWDGGSVADCPADLGDEAYEAIDAAISEAE